MLINLFPGVSAVSKFITAAQAVAKLGIRRQSLYAYVSRGLIRSEPCKDNARSRQYLLTDVEQLATQKKLGRAPNLIAKTTLKWGLPVLESSISLVERGRLYYRGYDACRLAQEGATLESVSCLLWERPGKATRFSSGGPAPDLDEKQSHDPIKRAQAMLARREEHLPTNDMWREATTLVRLLATALVGAPLSPGVLHKSIGKAWGLNDAQSEILRVALILCADHELNASTFTVRCVTSTEASLSMALSAGLAALSGPLHGAATEYGSALIADAERLSAGRAIRRRTRNDDRVLCFGHPLYPDGDPRAATLLDMLDSPIITRLQEAAEKSGLPPPSVDFALAAVEYTLDLPAGAALIIFATGRTIGWIAHAMEQQRTGELIRPRARYTGPRPIMATGQVER